MGDRNQMDDMTDCGESEAPNSEYVPPRRKRNWRRVLLVVFVLFAVVFGVIFYLLRSEPRAIREQREFIAKASEAELVVLAESVEDKLFNAEFVKKYVSDDDGQGVSLPVNATRQQVLAAIPVEVDPETEVFLTVQEINAWLALELDDWLNYRDFQRPVSVIDPMFAIDGGRMVMAFTVSASGYTQDFSAYFDVEILSDGMARLQVDEFYAGMVRIPVREFVGSIAEAVPDQEQIVQAAKWLENLEDITIKPVIKLEAKRRVQVLDYTISDEGIRMKVKLENYARKREGMKSLAGVQTAE